MTKDEWCTIQAKCLSCQDQTDRHKDTKNCSWVSYDKTGALCFVPLDAFGICWSLKFLSNSHYFIGSYDDKLLLVETLCARIKKHFANLDGASYSSFLDYYDGSFRRVDLNSRNPWGFFLDHRCKWSKIDDTSGMNKIVYRCLVLPTTIVRDFWLLPGVHIIVDMRALRVSDLRNPWGFFLDHQCKWSKIDNMSGKNKIVYHCLVLPTTVRIIVDMRALRVSDFWLLPGVHIIVDMRALRVSNEKLLELILLGGYQTSWFR